MAPFSDARFSAAFAAASPWYIASLNHDSQSVSTVCTTTHCTHTALRAGTASSTRLIIRCFGFGFDCDISFWSRRSSFCQVMQLSHFLVCYNLIQES